MLAWLSANFEEKKEKATFVSLFGKNENAMLLYYVEHHSFEYYTIKNAQEKDLFIAHGLNTNEQIQNKNASKCNGVKNK